MLPDDLWLRDADLRRPGGSHDSVPGGAGPVLPHIGAGVRYSRQRVPTARPWAGTGQRTTA